MRRSPATYVPGPMEMLGCVTDRESRGIAGASVVPEIEGARADLTAVGWRPIGEDGRYDVTNVIHPGWYTITAAAPGYEPVSKRVVYRDGHTAGLDFAMERER